MNCTNGASLQLVILICILELVIILVIFFIVFMIYWRRKATKTPEGNASQRRRSSNKSDQDDSTSTRRRNGSTNTCSRREPALELSTATTSGTPPLPNRTGHRSAGGANGSVNNNPLQKVNRAHTSIGFSPDTRPPRPERHQKDTPTKRSGGNGEEGSNTGGSKPRRHEYEYVPPFQATAHEASSEQVNTNNGYIKPTADMTRRRTSEPDRQSDSRRSGTVYGRGGVVNQAATDDTGELEADDVFDNTERDLKDNLLYGAASVSKEEDLREKSTLSTNDQSLVDSPYEIV